ncbi:hypothetical protein-transmembrane prediction [Rhodopirellula baltica SH 1]|uniref:Uncharacterized protein n=1 Tax=Rhodopirellula baltica (strain DSM 10527 / NCIMB 13988 / SH1) TaxID=243090 RepID=Q7URU5_RHOBA|nr:hypothetical protein-transmembrane prediction [Rhodopirellula baltica SH 1]
MALSVPLSVPLLLGSFISFSSFRTWGNGMGVSQSMSDSPCPEGSVIFSPLDDHVVSHR